MTLPVWNGTAADESSGNLNVLVSPTVTVTDKATGAQPNLFSDRAGNTGIGNPFTANADGSIEFYVAPGRYKVEATKGGETVTWDNQLIGTVHGAEHLWKLATVEIITVAGNASSPTDDAYSADLGGNLSADDTFIGRIANRNETTTPTFENTGGTPGALTITAYDGRPLWPGALEGDHRFQYEAGTSPETWLVLDPNDMGVVDPEHATDSATDTYVSATNTTPPADGVTITRDFQSANTTTTPTLDGKTMTTRDGSALWAGAVSGPHELQRDQTADTYLVLEPSQVNHRGWELVGTVEAANDATLTITGLDSTYDTYAIAFSDLHPATDGVAARMLVGDSGGIDNGASDYQWLVMGDKIDSTTFSIAGLMDNADSIMSLGLGSVGNSAGEGLGGMIYLHRPADGTTFPMFSGSTTVIGGDGNSVPAFFYGTRLAAITLDRIRFLFSSGNVESGRVTVWGIRHD